MSEPTYILAGGGSGGHLYPGVAVARTLLEREPAARVLFAGSDREIERRILSAEQLPHVALPAVSSAELSRRPLRFLLRNWRAYRAAGRLLAENDIRAVVALGGFASVPVGLAGAGRRLPLLLLEQNVIPGRAVRLLARCAARVCLSFAETERHLPRRALCAVTGNPVRREIAALCNERAPECETPRRTLLVLGGSQGARTLNAAVTSFVQQHHEMLTGWRIVHQTGPNDVEAARNQYTKLEVDAEARAFLRDLPELYRTAGLVVSRAGGTTLAELACAGIPAVLVPYAHAADDHQTANADWYAERGAAVVVHETGDPATTAVQLAGAVAHVVQSDQQRRAMARSMSSLARPAAAEAVVEQLVAAHERRDGRS